MNILRNIIRSALTIFSNLSPNSKVMMGTEVCWVIPMAWIGVYVPLYMKALGLSETQIGWTAFFVVLAQIIGVILGGFMADHWGRKKTLMLFDAICWGSPLMLWILAGYSSNPFWIFVIASMIWGFGMIVAPSWFCLFTEESTHDQTQNAFAIYWLMLSANGIFAPIGGYLVAQLGMVTAFRYMMIVSILTVSMGLSYRLIFLRETKSTPDSQSLLSSGNLPSQWEQHSEAASWAWKQPLSRMLLFSGMIHTMYAALWANFSPLYWTDQHGLQLSNSIVSLIPACAAISTIFVIVGLLPKIRKNPGVYVLLGGAGLITLGMIFMLINPPKTMFFLAVYAVVFAGGIGIFNPTRDSLFLMSLTVGNYRAKILAIVNLALLLVALPMGPIGGYLYKMVGPKIPFYFCLMLSLFNFILLLRYSRNHRRDLREIIPPDKTLA